MHINHRRRNKRQRRMGKVAARLGLQTWDERNVLDPDVPLVTLRREGK